MTSTAGTEAAPTARRWPSGRSRVLLAVLAAALLAVAAATALTAAGGGKTPQLPIAKNFSLAELGQPGQHVSLAADAGRPVLINFFASWCPPCKRETPLLARFYAAHHGQVLVIGVDSNDQASAALQFVHADGVAYPVGFDPFPAPVTTSYGVLALPQTFLLNARHQVVRHIVGSLTASELSAWAATVARTGAG